jgi:TonB family protein
MKFLTHLPHVSETTVTSVPRRHTFRHHRLAPVLTALLIGLPWTIAMPVDLQSQAPQPAPSQQPQGTQNQPNPAPAPTPAATPAGVQAKQEQAGEITEDQLKQLLVGKPLFLRGSYLGDSLSFTEHGDPTGHPAISSFTLSAVEIDKVRLTKHRVELEGSRYALHFLGALPYEDSSNAVDRIKITPKKKVLKISIDREQVMKSKKSAVKDKSKKPAPGTTKTGQATSEVASSETDAAPQTATNGPETGSAKVEMPAADQASVTVTMSPAHAAKILRDALDRVFAPGLDDKLRAQMPEFWQLYYQAQAAGVDYRPRDTKVLRSTMVDQQAKLTSVIAPGSNEYAQANGIVGRALYRAVIGADGKPGEIAVVRPIGFGLDENAVAAIRQASFQPAVKNGQPVAETLDLAVLFRIYSKRTSEAATETQAAEPAKPLKPGPYSVNPP